jgi:hypothetical protein
VAVGRLEDPERYVLWYKPSSWFLEPDEFKSLPSYVLEYDRAGHELARRTVPPRPLPTSSSAKALFGLVTPMTEAAALVETSHALRALGRAHEGKESWLLARFLQNWTEFFIPGVAPNLQTPGGVILGYLVLMLFSATGCALACFLLARRYAFSRARCTVWVVCGFLYGWVGLLLLLALEEWPARVGCPSCGRPRRVDRERCEHCGAEHAVPARDGTEVFEDGAPSLHAVLAGR